LQKKDWHSNFHRTLVTPLIYTIAFMDGIPQSLGTRACGEAWLHNRKQLHIPLGGRRFSQTMEVVISDPFKVFSLSLCNLGVQPLVIHKPPLMQLLLYGCGCAECARFSLMTAERKETFTSQELLCIYAAVFCMCSATSTTDVRKGKLAINTQLLNQVVQTLKRVQVSMARAQQCSTHPVWKAVVDACKVDAPPFDLTQNGALVDSVAGMCGHQAAAYTIEMINHVELLLWAQITAREVLTGATEAEQAQIKSRLFTLPICTTQADVLPLAANALYEKACTEWEEQFERGVQTSLCDAECKSRVLKEFPAYQLFPRDTLVAVDAAVRAKFAAEKAPLYVSPTSSALNMMTVFASNLMLESLPKNPHAKNVAAKK